MITRGRLGLVVAVALLCATASACSEDSGRAPIAGDGVITSPRRPIVVRPLPAGWLVQRAEYPGEIGAAMQTLYLPSRSTPEAGPALAVGRVGPEDGFTLCQRGEPANVRLGPSAPDDARVMTSGPLTAVEGTLNEDEDRAYVIGRGVKREQVVAAARAIQLTPSGSSAIAAVALPSGFRRFASAPVLPNWTLGEHITLTNDADTARISIGAYDGDAAADALSAFWNVTVAKETCGDHSYARVPVVVSGTTVVVEGSVPKALLEQIAGRIVATDQTGFDAFQTRVSNLPASALGCGGDGVLIQGRTETVTGTVRWVLNLSEPEGRGKPVRSCTGFLVNGKIVPGMSGGGNPDVGDAREIRVLEHSSQGADGGGAYGVVGGTVPKAAVHVVIANATGGRTEAVFAADPSHPNRKYFAGLLVDGKQSAASLDTIVVAYDADGAEIAHSP